MSKTKSKEQDHVDLKEHDDNIAEVFWKGEVEIQFPKLETMEEKIEACTEHNEKIEVTESTFQSGRDIVTCSLQRMIG